jgi:hypothetical protein
MRYENANSPGKCMGRQSRAENVEQSPSQGECMPQRITQIECQMIKCKDSVYLSCESYDGPVITGVAISKAIIRPEFKTNLHV